MHIIVIETENKTEKRICWDSKEDFNKFIMDIETVQRHAENWPSVPLEMNYNELEVSWNKQIGPRTMDEKTTIKPEEQPK